jgi:anti-sigma-K factor RskA
MARDEHAPFLENIPAYALGALDTDEVAALESHLAVCPSCRTELADYQRLSAGLLSALPPDAPPPALKRTLAARLPSARQSSRPQRTWSLSRLALGFAVLALLVLNLISFTQLRQIQNQQIGLLDQIRESQFALAMLSSPSTQMLAISGGEVSGTILLDRENNKAVLIAQNVPALAQSQTYQIWLIKPDGGRDSAGLFHPESGQPYTTKSILPVQSFSNYLGIGVTVEPAGGSNIPTGERLFKVDF